MTGFVRAALAAAGIASAAALSSCATQPRAAGQAAPLPAGLVHAVQMTATYQFVPDEIRINVGDTIEWRNVSPFGQTVTGVRSAAPLLIRLPTSAAEFDSGIVRPGDAFRHTFTVVGVYQYISRLAIGVDMVGTVVVTERR